MWNDKIIKDNSNFRKESYFGRPGCANSIVHDREALIVHCLFMYVKYSGGFKGRGDPKDFYMINDLGLIIW